MLQRAFRWGSACAVLVLIGSTLASAAEFRPPPSAAQQAYRAKQVIGAKVSIDGGVSIGTADDVVFADDGVVEYLIVNNEGKLVTIPWEAAKFNFEQRTATVKITSEQFQRVPTYTAEKYPMYFAPEYRTQTYKYYGLTPRQARRVDRKLD